MDVPKDVGDDVDVRLRSSAPGCESNLRPEWRISGDPPAGGVLERVFRLKSFVALPSGGEGTCGF